MKDRSLIWNKLFPKNLFMPGRNLLWWRIVICSKSKSELLAHRDSLLDGQHSSKRNRIFVLAVANLECGSPGVDSGVGLRNEVALLAAAPRCTLQTHREGLGSPSLPLVWEFQPSAAWQADGNLRSDWAALSLSCWTFQKNPERTHFKCQFTRINEPALQLLQWNAKEILTNKWTLGYFAALVLCNTVPHSWCNDIIHLQGCFSIQDPGQPMIQYLTEYMMRFKWVMWR